MPKFDIIFNKDEVEESCLKLGDNDPVSVLLDTLGKRGVTVLELLSRLQKLAKVYGKCMDAPQFALRRRFAPVIWSRPQQIIVKVVDPNCFELKCHAKGFPFPHFQWMKNGIDIDEETSDTLFIHHTSHVLDIYRCRVWNEVEEGMEYSNFYRSKGKQYRSELLSDAVSLKEFGNNLKSEPKRLVATDKVALIIGNRRYEHHVELSTPECDIEALTHALQYLHLEWGSNDREQFGFKTVQLSDLNLEEMKFFVSQYKKLLDDGIYAIFYFAGHGFEVAGQCYLLPVDAPADFRPEHCISVNWVQSVFRHCTPSLNLMLLDICRMSPANTLLFAQDVAKYYTQPAVCQNSVCGFATSVGVCAFEAQTDQTSIFMKYLLPHLHDPVSITDVLNRTFADIACDEKVSGIQVPELRTNLTAPRSLLDPIEIEGHTVSYESHTLHWRHLNELPEPVYIYFKEQDLYVAIFFNLLGHFNNKMRVGSFVVELVKKSSGDEEFQYTKWANTHRAHLIFPEELGATSEEVVFDTGEGPTVCRVVSNLQRAKGGIKCKVVLCHVKHEENKAWVRGGPGISVTEANIGHALVTRILPQW
uniref:CASPASE_P20 domain-containing protein n=1 Tax=Syphacia muris TaxID=451379 RepID=A0A0N5AV95_9BILA